MGTLGINPKAAPEWSHFSQIVVLSLPGKLAK
jgi:hypothetical protein